jgi:hypothetical protein
MKRNRKLQRRADRSKIELGKFLKALDKFEKQSRKTKIVARRSGKEMNE